MWFYIETTWSHANAVLPSIEIELKAEIMKSFWWSESVYAIFHVVKCVMLRKSDWWKIWLWFEMYLYKCDAKHECDKFSIPTYAIGCCCEIDMTDFSILFPAFCWIEKGFFFSYSMNLIHEIVPAFTWAWRLNTLIFHVFVWLFFFCMLPSYAVDSSLIFSSIELTSKKNTVDSIDISWLY